MESIEVDPVISAQIINKVDTILTDTFTGQLSANKLLQDYLKTKRKDPDARVDQLWCILHTVSNLDKYGQRGLLERAQEALQLTKILFGSSKTSGYHKFDIKQT